MHSASGDTCSADESIGPSAPEERVPQDDKDVGKTLVEAGRHLADIHVHYEQQSEYKLTKTEKAEEK